MSTVNPKDETRLLMYKYNSVLLPNCYYKQDAAMKFINDNSEYCIAQMDTLVDTEQFNGKRFTGGTALHYACQNNALEVAQFFIKAGADIEKVDIHGKTPLNTAAYYGRDEMIELLIDNGADINTVDNKGYTPLRNAHERCLDNTIEYLISKGADINAPDKNGNTVLHSACKGVYSGVHYYRFHLITYYIRSGAEAVVNGKEQICGEVYDLVSAYYEINKMKRANILW